MNIKNRMNYKNNDENEDGKVKPLLKLKPKFSLLTALSRNHLTTLIAIIFIGLLLVQSVNINVLYFVAVLAIYFIYLLYKMVSLKNKYKKTLYLFFEDRIIILKKYGRQENIMIPYSDIADILFYQNYIQKFLYNLNKGTNGKLAIFPKLSQRGSLGIKISSGNIFNNIIMLESLDDLYGTIDKIQRILFLER